MDLALRSPANSLQYSQYTDGSFVDGLLTTLQALENKNFLTDLKRTVRAFEGPSAADVGGGFKRMQLEGGSEGSEGREGGDGRDGRDGGDGPAKRSRRY